VPWHRIERERGVYDSWMDVPMRFMESAGMRPVLDPLHHVSFPEWLDGGFADPDFPVRYEGFVTAVAQRYPWVESYTHCEMEWAWNPEDGRAEIRWPLSQAAGFAAVAREYAYRYG
jgi:hypothetical protein